MNIITWNVRGLGRSAKRFLVKDFLSIHHVEVCCLQESKLDVILAATWREIGGSSLDQFAFALVVGTSGGMIIGWNGAILAGKVERVGIFSITVGFQDLRNNFVWRYTTVYEPNARALKSSFWDELRGCGDEQHTSWVICGDFNAIFSTDDKHTRVHNLQEIRYANQFLLDLNLGEPPAVGRRFS